MSTLRNIHIGLELGQTILVGPNRKPAEITKIEYHSRSGEITINTTEGPRKALSFALVEGQACDVDSVKAADKYR